MVPYQATIENETINFIKSWKINYDFNELSQFRETYSLKSAQNF